MGKVSIKSKVNLDTYRDEVKWSQERYDELYKEHITDNPWQRPSDWIDVPKPTGDTIYLIYAVQSGITNRVEMTVQGDYNVDWGDGVTSGYTSDETSLHYYDYETCGGTDSDDGRLVMTTITPQSGGTLTKIYLNEQTSDYSGRVYWLEMKVNSPNITEVSNSSNYTTNSKISLRNIEIYDNGLTSLSRGFQNLVDLERVYIDKSLSNLTSFNYCFSDCYRLKYLDIDYSFTSSVSNFTTLFNECYSLVVAPLFDTSNGTIFTSMFYSCDNLKYVPFYDFSEGITMNNLFAYSHSLEAVPHVDTSKASNLGNFVTQCYNLTYVPLYDTSTATNFTNFFNGTRLKRIPKIEISQATSLSGLFLSANIGYVPDLDFPTHACSYYSFCYIGHLGRFPSGVTFYSNNSGLLFNNATVCDDNYPMVVNSGDGWYWSAFSNNTDVRKLPYFDTSGATDMRIMFQGCSYLNEVPEGVDTSSAENLDNFFSGCYNLKEIPNLDFKNATSVTTIFNNCTGLQRSRVVNMSLSHSYNNCSLGPDALNEIFTNLPSASSTITVTDNWGVSEPGYDPSIATVKGWTVAD